MNSSRFLLLAFFSCLCSSYVAAQQNDTIRFIIRFGERNAGSEKIWRGNDGYLNSFFEFNDRGRGPEILTKYKENENGFLTSLDANGKNYLKSPVSEKFSFENGKATWENESEKGTKVLSSIAFYSPLNGSGGNLVKALVTSPDKSVDVLPGGRAVLLLHQPHSFQLEGKSVQLYLCEIGGLGLTPNYLWADGSHSVVGNVSEWFSSIREGYESLVPELYKIQKSREDSYFEKWPTELVTKPKAGVAITNVTLFDSESAAMKPGMTVVVQGNKITAVGQSVNVKVPAGYTIIDGKGRTLMPGMWDMHVHYGGPADGVLNLGAGVTSVRDMANTTSLVETKKQIDEGKLVGPRIASMCGFIDGAGPYAGPTGEIVSSVEEGIEGVKKYAALGYPQIKLYSSIKPEWVAPITAEARKHNMRVSGHIPAYMTASEAIDAGYNEIQHINMLFLNFYGKDKDTRTPQRFTLVANNAASFDFASAEFKAFVSKMVTNNIVSDPTIAIFEEMFTSVPGEPNPVYASIKDRLPASSQRNVQTFGGLPADGKEELFKRSFDACMKMVKALYDNGVTIVAGTDAMAGFAYHRELELYAKAGIPANKVLQIATLNGATVAGKKDILGSIATSKLADMILIDGDPTKNISDVRNVDLVVKDGNLYDPAKLYSAVSIKPYR